MVPVSGSALPLSVAPRLPPLAAVTGPLQPGAHLGHGGPRRLGQRVGRAGGRPGRRPGLLRPDRLPAGPGPSVRSTGGFFRMSSWAPAGSVVHAAVAALRWLLGFGRKDLGRCSRRLGRSGSRIGCAGVCGLAGGLVVGVPRFTHCPLRVDLAHDAEPRSSGPLLRRDTLGVRWPVTWVCQRRIQRAGGRAACRRRGPSRRWPGRLRRAQPDRYRPGGRVSARVPIAAITVPDAGHCQQACPSARVAVSG